MIIFGASGHGKVVYDVLKTNFEEDIYFLDDAPKGTNFYNRPLYHSSEISNSNEKIIIAIGNNKIRKKIAIRYSNYIIAIDASAVISPSSLIKEGTVVMPLVCCNADSIIGKHVILNTNCSVDHDCIVGDFAHISPNAALAGNVQIGECTHVGIGASIIQGIKIGKNVTIGAGSVIINDIPDGATVVGNPGRVIKITNYES